MYPGHRCRLRNRRGYEPGLQYAGMPRELSLLHDRRCVYRGNRDLRQRGDRLRHDPNLDVCRIEWRNERFLF